MLLYLSEQGEGACFSFLILMMLPTFSFCHPSTALFLMVPLSEEYQLCQEILRDREAHPSPLLKKLLQEVPWVWAEKKSPQDWQNITPCGSSVDQPSHPSEAEALFHVNRSRAGNPSSHTLPKRGGDPSAMSLPMEYTSPPCAKTRDKGLLTSSRPEGSEMQN